MHDKVVIFAAWQVQRITEITSFRCAALFDPWQCFKWSSGAFIVRESTVLGQKEVLLVQKQAANVERRSQRVAYYHLSELTWNGMVYMFY